MAISGAFAGLGGAVDILGWEYHIGVARRPGRRTSASSESRWRCSAATPRSVSVLRAALRRAHQRHLDARPRPDGLPAALAGNLTLMIQALVLLFVGPTCSSSRSGTRASKIGAAQARSPGAVGERVRRPHRLRARGRAGCAARHRARRRSRSGSRCRPCRRARRRCRCSSGCSRSRVASGRSRAARPARVGRRRRRRHRHRARAARDPLVDGEPRLVVSWGSLVAVTLIWATPLDVRGDRRHVLRAERRREHRARGDDARGCLLRRPRRGQVRLVGGGAAAPRRSPAARSRSCTRSSRSSSAPTRSSAARRSTSSRSASPATSSSRSTARTARRATCRAMPDVNIPGLQPATFFGDAFGDLNLMIWLVVRAARRRARRAVQHADRPAPARRRRAPARRRDGRHLRLPRRATSRRHAPACSRRSAAPISRSASSAPSART